MSGYQRPGLSVVIQGKQQNLAGISRLAATLKAEESIVVNSPEFFRLTILGSLAFLNCWLVGCGATQAADPAEDDKLWQGTWEMVSCTWNGEPQRGDMQWIVEGDYYRMRVDRQTNADHYPFKLDARQKHIDVDHHDTPQGTYGGKLKGIYEINRDSLRVCYDLTGHQYPKSFDAGPGSRQVIYEFRRVP
jgi:uncharacterized protein (TIGR03067 family)